MIQRIRVWPDEVLRAPNNQPSPDEVEQIFEDLRDTCIKMKGLGLAAPQISKNYRMAIVAKDVPPDWNGQFENLSGEFIELIDPVCSVLTDFSTAVEGCLSIPGQSFHVSRAKRVHVNWISTADYLKNRIDVRQSMDARDYLALEFQHEIDHLDGKLVIDLVSTLRRDITKKRMLKFKKRLTAGVVTGGPRYA